MTLSIWKDPSCSTTTGAVFVRMRSCGSCSRWANALGIISEAWEMGERTSAVDMIDGAVAGGLVATVAR